MKTWDVVIVGGGVIGLSLGCRLRKAGASVLVVEKGEPAREATHAAGGMIAHCDAQNCPELASLIVASASMYPEFVRGVIEDSGETVDFRQQGTIAFPGQELPACPNTRLLEDSDLQQLEPRLARRGQAYLLPEASVDPRALGTALIKAARHAGVDFVTGSAVRQVTVDNGRATGVKTAHSHYPAALVVNSAGAWAAQIQPLGVPTHPVKGQIVCVVPQPAAHHAGPLIQHVVRTSDVYLIPRSDGRILLGATVEEAGFNKRIDADTVRRLQQSAASVAPIIGEMRIHDAWAGLGTGSPDEMPILGETSLRGYYAATGHYRDGIMLAPITAHLMTQLLTGRATDLDLAPFSPLRFKPVS